MKGPPGMSAPKDGDAAADTAEKEDPLRVDRRLIYLHRLMGDDVYTSKTKTTRRLPWYVVFTFLTYAVLASIMFVWSIDIPTAHGVNKALRTKLLRTPWGKDDGRNQYFENIKETDEISDYISRVLVQYVVASGLAGQNQSLQTSNRLLGRAGLCPDAASLGISVKRVQKTTDFQGTTSERFYELAPSTWKAVGVDPSSQDDSAEETSDWWLPYQYVPFDSQPPAKFLGFVGADTTDRWTYDTISPGSVMFYRWNHSAGCERSSTSYCGFKDAGGYIGLIVIKLTDEQQQTINRMMTSTEVQWATIADIADQMFIYLLDPEGSLDAKNETLGVCSELKASHVMQLKDFFRAIDWGEPASFVVEMDFYNANEQTVTLASVEFEVQAHGPIASKHVTVQTIRLDLTGGSSLVLFIIFILITAFSFIELFGYRLWHQRTKLLRDPWFYIKSMSITCCILSIVFRLQYESGNKELLETANALADAAAGPQLDESMLNDQIAANERYVIVSSLALVTIWLRVVELLARTPPTVGLLETTLFAAMANMLVYISYILVVMVGFVAFCSIHFSEVSSAFRDLWWSFVSCTEMFLLNVDAWKSTNSGSLSALFLFVYFMFAIVSVQMFNAIINYSYNRASEDMEPLMRKQHIERRSNQRHKAHSPFWQAVAKCKYCMAVICCRKENKDDTSKDDAVDRKAKGEGAVDTYDEHELDPNAKDRVEAFVQAGRRRQSNEGNVMTVLFLAYFVCYTIFLFLNLNVGTIGRTNRVMRNVMESETFYSVGSTVDTSFDFRLGDTFGVDTMASWFSQALPKILHPELYRNPLPGIQAAYFTNATSCIRGWNCIWRAPEQLGAPLKVARITMRMYKSLGNLGYISEGGASEPDDKFTFGTTFVSERTTNTLLNWGSDADTEKEDTTTDLQLVLNGLTFCEREPNGGFGKFGGIVCYLDDDQANMTAQLDIMMQNQFFGTRTGTVLLEYATYNGNTECLTLVRTAFSLHPSGLVEVELLTDSVSLIDFDVIEKGASDLVVFFKVLQNAFAKMRLLTGLICVILVCAFILVMVREIQGEIYRKRLNDDKKAISTLFEYFALDFFHMLDLLSFIISIITFYLYIKWVVEQARLREESGNSFSLFLDYCEEMVNSAKWVTRTASVNMLFISWRFLKYLRQEPQMAKLNMTLFNAQLDIAWFIVMLCFFFTGFMLMAHLNFGSHMEELSSIGRSILYCFRIFYGSFRFAPLWQTGNKVLAVVFFFPYLFLFKLFFLNVFFSIIDRHFVTGDVPAYSIKRVLKPMCYRLCRWVEWDEDYTMEGGGGTDKPGERADRPLSRAEMVRKTFRTIKDIQEDDVTGGSDGSVLKKSKMLSDVCDVDEKMNEVIRWSKEEGKLFVEKFRKLQQDRLDQRNDEAYLNNHVKPTIKTMVEKEKEAMEEAERHKRYAIQVKEELAKRDQETLAKYILRLENKIEKKMMLKFSLLTDVYHLRAESERMRCSEDEMQRLRDDDDGTEDTLARLPDQPATNGEGRPQTHVEAGANAPKALGDGGAAEDDAASEASSLASDLGGSAGRTAVVGRRGGGNPTFRDPDGPMMERRAGGGTAAELHEGLDKFAR